MKYEVTLRWHQDHASGEWGVCHENGVGTFNAFWGADGIFHDVFEHYFEGLHPYFSGQSMHTVYGEMAASGASLSFRDIGINNFMFREGSGRRNYIVDTTALLEDWLHGYCDACEYPIERELCRVPRQQEPQNCYQYNEWTNEYICWYDQKVSDGLERIKQIRKRDILNCYAWGYKRGQQLIRDKDQSREVLLQFLEQWNSITKMSPESLYIQGSDYGLRNIHFKVNSLPKLRIKCALIDEACQEYPLSALSSFE